MSGGGKVSGPGGSCTVGFPAVTGSGVPGLTTADHCPDNSTQYNGVSGALENASRFYPRGYGDLQWAASTGAAGAVKPGFYNGVRQRALLGSRDVRVQSRVCIYGQTTDAKKCGRVNEVHVQARYAGHRYKNLIEIHNYQYKLMAHPGDSGGPAFIGGYALGELVATEYSNCDPPPPHGDGCSEGGCEYWALFEPIKPLVTNSSGLGLHLMTR